MSLHFNSHHFTSLQFTLHISLPCTFGRFVTTLQKPITFPHFCLTCVIYRGKSFVHLQAVGSTIWLSYLHKRIYRYLFFVTWTLFYDRYHLGSDSTVLSPIAFHTVLRCALWRGGQLEVCKFVINRVPKNWTVFILKKILSCRTKIYVTYSSVLKLIRILRQLTWL